MIYLYCDETNQAILFTLLSLKTIGRKIKFKWIKMLCQINKKILNILKMIIIAGTLYQNHTSAWPFSYYYIFSEHLFLRTLLEGCFRISEFNKTKFRYSIFLIAFIYQRKNWSLFKLPGYTDKKRLLLIASVEELKKDLV